MRRKNKKNSKGEIHSSRPHGLLPNKNANKFKHFYERAIVDVKRHIVWLFWTESLIITSKKKITCFLRYTKGVILNDKVY